MGNEGLLIVSGFFILNLSNKELISNLENVVFPAPNSPFNNNKF